MKKNKVIVSWLLSVVIIFGNLSISAYAAEAREEETTDENAAYDSEKWEQNRIMQIDSEHLDEGYTYLPKKDTYIFLPEKHGDEELLKCTVKWFYESWFYGETGVHAEVDVLSIKEEDGELTLYGATAFDGSVAGGRFVISAKYKKYDDGVYQLVDFWTPADGIEGTESVKHRFPEEVWDEALDENTCDILVARLSKEAEEEKKIEYIVISADTPAEIIRTLYAELKNK